jgi:hypothetical protein
VGGAGCGSSSTSTVTKTPSASSSSSSTTTTGAGMSTGSGGTMGSPSTASSSETNSSGQYDLTKPAVLQGLANAIGKELVKRGDTNVNVSCTDISASRASCEAKGVNTKGESFDNVFTVTVNVNTGNFTVSDITSK